MGTGIGHYVPLIAYLGFWVMAIVSLSGRPLYGLYYMMPFVPYRTLRDHFFEYPLGTNILTILVVAVIVGALLHGKKLPKSRLYPIWLAFGGYLFISMWLGFLLGNSPAPLWLSDMNFVTWKDYMVTPLLMVAAGLVVEDRKAVRTVIIIMAISLLIIDRSALMESLSRSWVNFDENKRDSGPLGYGSNQTAAFLAQFAMFFWGFNQFIKRKKPKLLIYGLVALTIMTDMYTFSRGSYVALLVTVFMLGFLKDRKLLVIGGLFLFTWQLVVPAAVTQRVNMTQNADGQLEASAQERVNLWEEAKVIFISNPIVGLGFASYQYGQHSGSLKDTHNWYVKVLVETGLVGFFFALLILQQLLSLGYRLFKQAQDPLYKGFGLGLFLAVCSCIVANCFGDRWSYLEINGLLWILTGTAARALMLATENAAPEETTALSPLPPSPQMGWR